MRFVESNFSKLVILNVRAQMCVYMLNGPLEMRFVKLNFSKLVILNVRAQMCVC